MPSHLKQRGVLDVFHSSLLRIHIPNNDQLFPGRLDTQLTDGPGNSREWAVDKINNHVRKAEEAVFEITWKSGDVTWMPYYQIRHLRALDEYLNLMGVTDVFQLPDGRGKSIPDDPQIFLEAITCDPRIQMVLNKQPRLLT